MCVDDGVSQCFVFFSGSIFHVFNVCVCVFVCLFIRFDDHIKSLSLSFFPFLHLFKFSQSFFPLIMATSHTIKVSVLSLSLSLSGHFIFFPLFQKKNDCGFSVCVSVFKLTDLLCICCVYNENEKIFFFFDHTFINTHTHTPWIAPKKTT